MKRFVCLLLAAILMLSVTAFAADLPAPGTYPLSEDGEEITVMVYYDTGAQFDWATNYNTEWMEEQTGIHVNWLTLPIENFLVKMQLALSGGDQIDLICMGGNSQCAVTTSMVCKFADQGLILPIEDLIENNTVYMKERFDSVEGWREALTTPDGHIYAVPWYHDGFHAMYYGKMWINLTWLDNLSLAIPTTIDEFENMLIAFRDEDANGNGDPNDEIPMIGAIDNFGCKIDTFLMSAFIYDDGENRLMINEDGAVIPVFTQDTFREGLTWLAHLYDENLIYPDSFSISRSERNAINSENYESRCGAMPNIHHAIGSRAADEPVRWIEYEPIKPLVGPDGLQVTRYDFTFGYGLDNTAGLIPATCKDPELIMQWLDLLFSDEGMYVQYLGEYGVAWTEADEGTLGVDGSPARWKTLPIDEDSPYYNNTCWNQRFPMFFDAYARNGRQQPGDLRAEDGSGLEGFLYQKSYENYAPYGAAIETMVPPLYFGEEDASEVARLRTDINTYVEECIAKFINGQLDIESDDWDNYLAELKSMGLETYIDIIQRNYDASAFAK